MNFSKHRCPGQEWRRLLEVAKRTVSRSFLFLGFVASRSVMPAELSGVICGGIVLLPQVYVRVHACVCERCSFLILLLSLLLKEASHAGRYIPKIILTLHPLVQSPIRTLRRQRLARQKSPILTAQTTRPLQKKWFRGELWCASI